MMRTDALNLNVYPVITEMSSKKHIPILFICSMEDSKSEEFLVDNTLSQVWSTDEGGSKIIIADETITEVSKSKCVHKNINKEKDAKNEAEHEEPIVTDDKIFVKDPIHCNIFESGKNIMSRLDTTYKQACIATTRDKYYIKLYRTIIDYNNRNGAPFSNEKI